MTEWYEYNYDNALEFPVDGDIYKSKTTNEKRNVKSIDKGIGSVLYLLKRGFFNKEYVLCLIETWDEWVQGAELIKRKKIK